MFNVHINDGTNELPDDDIFYIVAKEGIFLRKKLGIMDSIAPVDKISTLQSVAASARMNIKKMPASTFAKIVDFFRKVYDAHYAEAVVLVFYKEDTQRYRIVPPYQKVSAASVDYNRGVTIEGWTMIGTIHSHAAMSAFHSGTDKDDEETFDGLHITVGNMRDQDVSITASIVANGYRVAVDPEDYVEGIKKVTDINEEKEVYTSRVYHMVNGKLELDTKASQKYLSTYRRKDKRYVCLAPKSKSSCNPKWLTVVEKGTYNYSWRNRNFGHNAHHFRGSHINYGYGYGYGYDPHAWHNSGRKDITFLEGNKPGITPAQHQVRNQFIIDNTDFDSEDTIPCISCKHREHKILVEEQELDEQYLFLCEKCKKYYTEDDLEETPTGWECPTCKTDDHFSLVDADELDSNYERMTESEMAFRNQPDQHGFFECPKCKVSFLKLSTDIECPFCEASLGIEEQMKSSEEQLIDQQSKDSGSLLNQTDEEAQEILRQAAEADEMLEKIGDPEQDTVPISKATKPDSLMGMFKRVFGKGI